MKPSDLTDDDFRTFSRILLEEMRHLDGSLWQAAQDLRDECYRGRVQNDLTARVRVAFAINARRHHSCCSHPVERHAYNGCANCGCSVRWPEHPGRFFDMSRDEHTRKAVARARAGRMDASAEV